jgi:hypothetical protein
VTVSTLKQSKQGRMNTVDDIQKDMSHLVSVCVETIWFATIGMTHFIQNGCLSGVGIADDQDSKALNGLFEC